MCKKRHYSSQTHNTIQSIVNDLQEWLSLRFSKIGFFMVGVGGGMSLIQPGVCFLQFMLVLSTYQTSVISVTAVSTSEASVLCVPGASDGHTVQAVSWRVYPSSPRYLRLPSVSLTRVLWHQGSQQHWNVYMWTHVLYETQLYPLELQCSASAAASGLQQIESPSLEVDTSPAVGLEASRLGWDYPAHSLMHTEPCATYILLLQFFETVPCYSDSSHSLQFKAKFYTTFLSKFLFFVLFLFVLIILFTFQMLSPLPSPSSRVVFLYN